MTFNDFLDIEDSFTIDVDERQRNEIGFISLAQAMNHIKCFKIKHWTIHLDDDKMYRVN